MVSKCALTLLLVAGSAAAQQTQQQVEQYNEPDELVLCEYVDIRINALEQAMQTGLSTAKEAVEKAERATELRFESVNEFRLQLGDQQRTFMPRQEHEQAYSALADRVEALSRRSDEREARAQGTGDVWPILFGVVGVIGILFTIGMAFFRKPEPTVLRNGK